MFLVSTLPIDTLYSPDPGHAFLMIKPHAVDASKTATGTFLLGLEMLTFKLIDVSLFMVILCTVICSKTDF